MTRQDLLTLAATYQWSTPAERVVAEDMPGLIARVMELGTWDDAHALLAETGPEAFLAVLDHPPAGVLSNKSLAFWHCRLGRSGPPPTARRRFD